MAIDLTFHGAARHVTGSCFLLQSARCRFLVHRGMFQGLAAVEGNAGPLAFDPRELDLVLLTHAHVDPSGLLPRLAAEGFTEPIHATAATADLLAIMLPDSAYLQRMATGRAHARRGCSSKGRHFRCRRTWRVSVAAIRSAASSRIR
jgi:metallo-beta-lactamase family protein